MFFAFRYPLAGAATPSLKQHIKRKEIYYVDYKVNLCFWTAYSFIRMPNTKDKRWKDSSRIAETKHFFNRVMRQEFHDNYKGFDFVNDIGNFINIEQVNEHIYIYESDLLHYELTQNYIVNDSDKQLNIIFTNDGINAHIMYISDVEALTGFRYCNICHKQAFRVGDSNLQISMGNHLKKCQKNGGKNIIKVILERFSKPFVPHILSNKTYKYLIANYLTNLFKSTQYFIKQDIEILEKNINEKFGDSSQVSATLIPYAIALTVKLASLVKVAIRRMQVKNDYKYKNEIIPQYYEVSVIGFNSAKFDTSVLFKNLKSKSWVISKYLRSSTIAKKIVMKRKCSIIELRFIDFKIYSMQNRLKDAVRDFGNGKYQKDRSPHEFVNVNNYIDELNKSELFLRDPFDNQLQKKNLSDAKYKDYLIETVKFTNR
ncbi:MAG: hypothetical protein EZS28_033068 [Streblomastix strix]|uniref:Uncharacterized protein n=1 Tax=Streblomastix strix TaxID=222440 RepID=A0A5J4UNT8_9EUKA|nr:MAG: hypothetical protein EZS28_033068 [Streblomastix strix]